MGFLRFFAWSLYQTAFLLLLLPAAPLMALRRGGRRLDHYLPTLHGRAALGTEPVKDLPRLWIHAVSVGEVGVAATLARRLPPDLPLVVTTVTPTGQAHARRLFAAHAFENRDVAVTYMPFDLGPPVGRFLRRFRPRALILTEGDYWPYTLARVRRSGLPILVANGRVSERAFRRQKRLGPINRLFYGPIDLFAVQTEQDRERLIHLGAEASKVHVAGNVKFDSEAADPKPAVEKALDAAAGGRAILIAGSTMDGEETAVLKAFRHAGGGERALLVLVPRHPERWDAVAELLASAGLPFVRRSAFSDAPTQCVDGSPAVVLLDSLGELAAVYRVADAAFIGGTLVPTGGHNPLEAAVFATPIVVGPSMFNFAEIAAAFDHDEAWERADDAEQLGDIWRRWLEDPAAARAVGARAGAVIERHRGAATKTATLFAPFLEDL